MKQKLLTCTVPCYNSAEYMRKCIESLLVGGEEVEIVIVNDGSADGTLAIAREYEAAYPSVVRVVDKENGGHGSGVNAGLERATGLYFKVVDSDDWLDEDSFKTLLVTIGAHVEQGCEADLYITDFVYEKVCEGKRFRRSFRRNFPRNKTFFGWDDVGAFRYSSVLMMHALLYKTQVLRDCGLVLPEHTFYVDNIYMYKPLPHTKRLCYLELPLYRYFIGREDQSVSHSNITKRYLQQIRVMKEMVAAYSYEELRSLPKGLRKYMKHVLGVIMVLTVMFTTAGKDNIPARVEAMDGLWEHIRTRDKKLFRFLSRRTYPALVYFLPFRLQGMATELGYRFFRERIKCS